LTDQQIISTTLSVGDRSCWSGFPSHLVQPHCTCMVPYKCDINL